MGVITPIASNSWMVYLMEHPISIDTLGGTPFQETPVGMQYIGRDIISYNMFLIATPKKMPISCRTWNIRRKHHSSLVFTTYSGQLFGGPVYYITTWVWDKICQNGMRRGQFFLERNKHFSFRPNFEHTMGFGYSNCPEIEKLHQ